MDSVSEGRLQWVHPHLAEKIRQMAQILDGESVILRVTQGLRTWSEQAALYAQGRTAPGKIVTNAAPGHSWHNFGLACDVAPMNQAGQPDWNTSHPVWQRIVYLGTSLGLESGAQWRTFPDWPHFQLTGTLPVSPTEEVIQAYHDSNGDLSQIWKLAGLDVDDNTVVAG